ncbi:GNAT family N-acetyltransferase [Bradyrhizobium sp. HKCCYLS2038]|uniref:GNAT family N-acetyltransferase n=1 Tax=unclassified Bradyrhizobium TaxID=2631580 RepID=UPI003EBB6F27
MIVLERVGDRLPAGFNALEADARADGHAHLNRLASELIDTPAMFHHVFAALVSGRLAGIGAMTDEPAPTEQPVWRMRRFYVQRACRRHGVARTIAVALLKVAAGQVGLLTVHAGNDGAARFWEAMGFDRVADRGWSHQRRS